MSSMKIKLLIIAGVLVAIVATAGGTVYAYWDQAVPLAGMAINYVRSWSAPSGTTTTELAAAAPEAAGAPVPSRSSAARPPEAAAGDWPSYNKTLTSERYSQLSQINTTNTTRDNTRASRPARSW
jgi:alcohol dehydrogenase (cytochrome c)